MSEGIYTTPEPTDDIYETLSVSDPENTAQHGGIELTDYENLRGSDPGNTAQHGGFKKNFFKAVAACVGLLLLAGIIVLVILYLDLTKQRDQWNTRPNNMTDQRDQWKTRFDELMSRHTNLTELKRILCESHGFTLGGDWCYYISTERKTWEDSRAFCTARQSDLMTIKSREKQDFVGFVGESKDVWIGLTDLETEGVWKWVDGTPLTTSTYWAGGQPDDGEGQDCDVFYKGRWYDYPCGQTRYWICEIVF